MEETRFYQATLADLEHLVTLRMLFSDELVGRLPPEKDQLMRERLREYFRKELNHTYFAWLAEINQQVVTHAGLIKRIQPPNAKNPSGIWGYVVGVFTLPEKRNIGLAKTLMDRLLQTGAEEGMTAFELHATPDGARVYPKSGFSLFGEPTFRKYLDPLI